MTVVAQYRKLYADAWDRTDNCRLTAIAVDKQGLLGRITEFETSGRTTQWLRKPKRFLGVQDSNTGHCIHLVTDRGLRDGTLMQDILLAFRIMAWLASNTTIIWYWWDQPWTRILPPFTKPGKQHLNGGWTVIGSSRCEVHVYRREEAHKVLIHECIHALHMDVPNDALLSQQRTRIEHTLGRTLYPHLGEAFTELFAEWLWSIVLGGDAWAHQMRCAEKQAAELWVRTRTQKETETTSVFAYYILKWVLFQHLEHMLLAPKESVNHWCDWWITARPQLDHLASRFKYTERLHLRLGMTCGQS